MALTPSPLAVVGFNAMPEIWVPIVVAVITGPVVVVLSKLRKENSEQHAEGRELLQAIGAKVDNRDPDFRHGIKSNDCQRARR